MVAVNSRVWSSKCSLGLLQRLQKPSSRKSKCMYMHCACQCSATCTCTCTCMLYGHTNVHTCITITSPQFSVEVQHFEMFLSGHMYALTNQPPREDVLQLALLVPGTSEVNRQAKGIVHNERKRSWFDWT